jgi:protein-S-isoprenylcysteine O-methyltransferase Ste14
VVAVVVYSILAVMAMRAWPEVLRMDWLDDRVRYGLSATLFGLGLPLWAAGGRTVMRAYNQDELMTTGPFALVRHPLYSSLIVLILPGLAILIQCLPLFGASLVGYAVFKSLIGREDDYLRERFGQAYEEYRARVNELLPVPRLRN